MKNNSIIKRTQQGFTLTELMIVVAIIGILASVALPAYSTYTAKSSFSEVIASTAGVKVSIEVCGQTSSSLAKCNKTDNAEINTILGGAAGGKNVATVDITMASGNPVITATAGIINGLNGETYILTSELINGAVTWKKTGTCTGKGFC